MHYKDYYKEKQERAHRRHVRIRAKVHGTAGRPRLSVFRSNSHIFAQLIDDKAGKTIVSAHTRETDAKKAVEGYSGKSACAYHAGVLLAERAKAKGVEKAVFDKGPYKYHGRVRAVAEGARSAGLVF